MLLAPILICACSLHAVADTGPLYHPRDNTLIVLRTDDEKEARTILLRLQGEGFVLGCSMEACVEVGYLSESDEARIREKFAEEIEYMGHDEVDPHQFDKRGKWVVSSVETWNVVNTESGRKRFYSGPLFLTRRVALLRTVSSGREGRNNSSVVRIFSTEWARLPRPTLDIRCE